MRKFVLVFALLLATIIAGSANSSFGQGIEGSVLFVAPHRLIVTPGEKTETISVSNKSDQPRRYDLMLIDQVMNDKGVTQRVDKAPYSVKGMVEYRPQRFTLQPGQSQIVRLAVNRPAGLPDGDYHSHLLFREVPLSMMDTSKAQTATASTQKTATFEIRTLYGIGVPVIVQQGKIVSDIALGDVSLGGSGANRVLAVGFTRSGNAEAAGKFTVTYAQAGKKPVDVIDPQWVRIYREADKITKTFPLALPKGAAGGTLTLSLMRDEANPKMTITKEIALK